MIVIVQFSGGKDSQACLIWACKKYGVKNVIAQFSDTGIESSVTYKHIQYCVKKLGCRSVVLKNKAFKRGMFDLVIHKKRFPSSQARFCTEFLKVRPFIDWLLDTVKDNVLIVQGIRASESLKRSKMAKQCTFFKYYFEPVRIDKTGRKVYYNYRSKEVKEYVKKYEQIVLRPLFKWSAMQVIQYIYKNNMLPNPLYKKGFKRVGCFPCVLSGLNEIKSLVEFFPERIEQLNQIEIESGHTYFTSGKIPTRFCANGQYPTILEVVKYVKNQNNSLDLFREYGVTCLSYYSQCE